MDTNFVPLKKKKGTKFDIFVKDKLMGRKLKCWHVKDYFPNKSINKLR